MRRALALALLAVSGCSKCGSAPAAPTTGVERVLPTGAQAYVIVPSVEGLGSKLTLLEGLKVANFAAQATGQFENAHQYVDQLVSDLGIDVRSKEQLDKIGIAAGSSAGVAIIDDDGTVLLALPIKDEGRVGAFIRTFSANRLGASALEDKVENGVTVHQLMGPSAPRLAWATSNGYALIAPKKAIDRLAGWAARGEADTLAKDTSLPASLQRLPAERDAIVYIPPGKASLVLPVAHVVFAISLTASAFTVTVDAPWGGDAAALKLFQPKSGADLLGLLPIDAFAVARFSGDSALLAPLVKPLLNEQLKRALGESGYDFEKNVLQNLAPGSVVGVSLAPTVQMGQGLPELDVRRTNPFSFVHVSGVAQARSAEVVEPALAALAAAAPKFGAQMTLKDGVYVTTYSQGEGVHLAAKNGLVMFGSPLSRVDALLHADPNAPGPVRDAQLGEVLMQHALGVVVDLRKLSDAVRELPPSAWGIGGFAIKATTLRWLDNTDDLRAVTLTVGTKGPAVQARLQLLLGAKPGGSFAGGTAGDAGQ